MLSARAYSFRQQSRLAISLSFIGGQVNGVALIAMGTFVSHVTGTVTNIGRTLVIGDRAGLLFFGFLLGSYCLGALGSSLMMEIARRRSLHSKFIIPMATEGVLLLVLALGFEINGGLMAHGELHPSLLMGVASAAMGLQNATITRISGGVIRTTHLTGIFTDFAIESVQLVFWWRDRLRAGGWRRLRRVAQVARRNPALLRLTLLASIAGSFLLGGILATVIWLNRPDAAYIVPMLMLGWIIFVDWRRPIADVRELDGRNDPELSLHGIDRQHLPRELGLYRFSCPRARTLHRPPDFQLWVDHLPQEWVVVVLAMSPLTRLDRNAMMDLDLAIRRLHDSGRDLVISGITPVQYKVLVAHGITRRLDIQNLCPDMEFGIARAIAVLEERSKSAAPAVRVG